MTAIELEGVRVHNLRNLRLSIRHHAFTVICGVSGSGKSSLAFDTLFAEGQRRYIETFSPAVRLFLDRVERPAADRITGLPPAIAIRQQLRADGPRNTVGTRSEILDALRILFARLGHIVCPDCGIRVQIHSPESAAGDVTTVAAGRKIQVIAPIVIQPGEFRTRVLELVNAGFTRAIWNSSVVRLEELVAMDLPAAGALQVVVDRLRGDITAISRITEAIETAMCAAGGRCHVLVDAAPDTAGSVPAADVHELEGTAWQVRRFSRSLECPGCGRRFSDLSPELLSFTSPLGACPECQGTGCTEPLKSNAHRRKQDLKARVGEVCGTCRGSRLNRDAEAVRCLDLTLPQLCDRELSQLPAWLAALRAGLSAELQRAVHATLEFAERRLSFLLDCGLSYLCLSRPMKSLSGGESQRVMLTSALGSGLVNTLYVLDEPTAGLHAADSGRILNLVRRLRDQGNTVVVVEHDAEFIEAADEVIEIGPDSGEGGGTIVFSGSPAELRRQDTATGKLLQSLVASGKGSRNRSKKQKSLPDVRNRRSPEQWLEMTGVDCHNLRGIDIRLPLGVLCLITGVSGSGKSSLITETLFPALADRLGVQGVLPGAGTCRTLSGAEHLEQVLLLDQAPIRRTPRSIPVTWLGVFDEIRRLLAETHEARKRNYSRAMFSFNAASGGRCPVCEGRGVVTIEMQFLADIESLCEECGGRRFRPEVLEIRYRDRSVDDILGMTADEAFLFFSGHHRIQQRLNAMRQAGLGYLRLGQLLTTLSGGEAQRLRIAAMLAGLPLQAGEAVAENRKRSMLVRSGRTLFLLDEPSVGLHHRDIGQLIGCLDHLLLTGHSVIVIDHDPALRQAADWCVELGPGAGIQGGRITRNGPPE